MVSNNVNHHMFKTAGTTIACFDTDRNNETKNETINDLKMKIFDGA